MSAHLGVAHRLRTFANEDCISKRHAPKRVGSCVKGSHVGARTVDREGRIYVEEENQKAIREFLFPEPPDLLDHGNDLARPCQTGAPLAGGSKGQRASGDEGRNITIQKGCSKGDLRDKPKAGQRDRQEAREESRQINKQEVAPVRHTGPERGITQLTPIDKPRPRHALEHPRFADAVRVGSGAAGGWGWEKV